MENIVIAGVGYGSSGGCDGSDCGGRGCIIEINTWTKMLWRVLVVACPAEVWWAVW